MHAAVVAPLEELHEVGREAEAAVAGAVHPVQQEQRRRPRRERHLAPGVGLASEPVAQEGPQTGRAGSVLDGAHGQPEAGVRRLAASEHSDHPDGERGRSEAEAAVVATVGGQAVPEGDLEVVHRAVGREDEAKQPVLLDDGDLGDLVGPQRRAVDEEPRLLVLQPDRFATP